MFFRIESHDDEIRRTVRTEVTVQVRQRTVLFSSTAGTGSGACPLCGNSQFSGMEPLTEAQSQPYPLGLSDGQRRCAGPENVDETEDLRRSGDARRLR
jgi:hypothetical protein